MSLFKTHKTQFFFNSTFYSTADNAAENEPFMWQKRCKNQQQKLRQTLKENQFFHQKYFFKIKSSMDIETAIKAFRQANFQIQFHPYRHLRANERILLFKFYWADATLIRNSNESDCSRNVTLKRGGLSHLWW